MSKAPSEYGAPARLPSAAVKTELERIDAASALGLASCYNPQGAVDYTQFKPRGHYEPNSLTRAYFRAMVWLGQVGWNLQTEQGIADSMNFALAMSHDRWTTSEHRQACSPMPPLPEHPSLSTSAR